MQVNADVDLGCVAPKVVPDVVGEDIGPATAEFSRNTREYAVHICQRAGGRGGEVVALVKIDAHGVDGRNAND